MDLFPIMVKNKKLTFVSNRYFRSVATFGKSLLYGVLILSTFTIFWFTKSTKIYGFKRPCSLSAKFSPGKAELDGWSSWGRSEVNAIDGNTIKHH